MEKKYQQHHIPTVSEIKQTQTVHYDYKYIKNQNKTVIFNQNSLQTTLQKKTFEKCTRLCILPVLNS